SSWTATSTLFPYTTLFRSRDEGSLNGVYLKLRPQSPWLLNFGDMFRIGQEIIKLEALEQQPPGSDGVERLGSPRDGYVGRLALRSEEHTSELQSRENIVCR